MCLSTALVACLAFAEGAPVVPLDNTAPQSQIHETAKIEQDKVFWPMMAGESLEQLATKFYPNNPILKQRFINKTLSMSKALGINVQPDVPFKSAQLLIIPNEKAVSELTHRIKKAEEILPQQEKLKMSYGLKQKPAPETANVMPPKTAPLPSKNPQSEAQVNTSVLQVPPLVVPEPLTPEPVTPAAQEINAVPPPVVQPEIDTPKTAEIKAEAKPANTTQFSLPKVKMPEISMPKIELPNVEFGKYWQQFSSVTQRWFQQASQKAGHVMLSVNQQAVALLDEFEGKSIQEVWNNYQLRNAILLSLLLPVFIVLWVLHKKRKRKQAMLLSVINDTIAPENAPFLVEIPNLESPSNVPEQQVFDQNQYR